MKPHELNRCRLVLSAEHVLLVPRIFGFKTSPSVSWKLVMPLPTMRVVAGGEVKSILEYVPQKEWCHFSHIIASDLNALETEFQQAARARVAMQQEIKFGVDLPLQALAERVAQEYLFPYRGSLCPTRPRYGLPLAQPAREKPNKRARRVTFKEEVTRVRWPYAEDHGAQDRCNDHGEVAIQIYEAMGKSVKMEGANAVGISKSNSNIPQVQPNISGLVRPHQMSDSSQRSTCPALDALLEMSEDQIRSLPNASVLLAIPTTPEEN